jgi:hypothetical protein
LCECVDLDIIHCSFANLYTVLDLLYSQSPFGFALYSAVVLFIALVETLLKLARHASGKRRSFPYVERSL